MTRLNPDPAPAVSTGFAVQITFHTPDADKAMDCPDNVREKIGAILDSLGIEEEIDYTLDVRRCYGQIPRQRKRRNEARGRIVGR